MRVGERHVGEQVLLVPAQALRVVGRDLLRCPLRRPDAHVREAALEHAVVVGVFRVVQPRMLVADRLRSARRRGEERPSVHGVRLGDELAVHVELDGRARPRHRHVRPRAHRDHAAVPGRLVPAARARVERAQPPAVDEEDVPSVAAAHVGVDPVAVRAVRLDVLRRLHPRLHGEVLHAGRELPVRRAHAVRGERIRRPVGVLQHDGAARRHGQQRNASNRRRNRQQSLHSCALSLRRAPFARRADFTRT